MNDLPESARVLLAQGRNVHDPSMDAKARAWTRIERRLALGAAAAVGSAVVPRSAAGAGGSSTMPAALSGVGGAAKVVVATVIAIGAATGVAMWPTGHRVPVVRSAQPAVTATVVPPPPVESPQPPPAFSPPPAPASIRPHVRTEPSLAAEMQLLAAAQSAIHQGNPRRGLALVHKHRARFLHGQLVEEREAAEVAALCRLGRTAEARHIAERMTREHPGSTLSVGAGAECQAEPAAKPRGDAP